MGTSNTTAVARMTWMLPTRRSRRACVSALAVAVLWCAFAADAAAQTDREALEALYDATDGDNWHDNTNWKTSAPLGAWHGVVITPAGDVTAIRLPRNNLRGPLPREMAALDNLVVLNLSQNDLTRGAFEAVAGLPRLRDLDLSYNWGMTGRVPTDRSGYWSSLDFLNISVTRMCAPADWRPRAEELSNSLGYPNYRLQRCETEDAALPIDIAVVYTPEARLAACPDPATCDPAESREAIEAEIDLMIAETNHAYAASGVNHRIRLVGRDEVAYTETGNHGTDLRRLRNGSDGHMDEVQDFRERTAADLVHLIVGQPHYCGVAYILNPFGLTWRHCGGRTFAHELGHNMGLFHDRYVDRNNLDGAGDRYADGRFPPHPAFGYVNHRAFEPGATKSDEWFTIMSYGSRCYDANKRCARHLRFSNPRQSYNGDPLGVPYGGGGLRALTAPADAAAVLNRTGAAIALWRTRPTDPSANGPPRTVRVLPNRTMVAGQVATIDVSSPPAFDDPEGHALRYTVESLQSAVVEATGNDSIVTLTAKLAGMAVIRVTATDAGSLSVSQLFNVTVTPAPNQPPRPVGALASLDIPVGGMPVPVDVSGVFQDPDDLNLTYTAVSSATSFARVNPTGSPVTVTPVAVGNARVTVTATDPGNLSAMQSFDVRVTPPPNRPPEPVGMLAPLDIPLDAPPMTVDVSGGFRDPDGDTLTYGVVSSAPLFASVAVNGSMVTVTPVAEGTATVRVTATDRGGTNTTVAQDFIVKVGAPLNQPPELVGTLAPLQIAVHAAPVRVDVSGAFRDPEGQALTYGAVSSALNVVAVVRVDGSEVVLNAVGVGTAAIDVTATDPGPLDAMQSFVVTVSDADRRALEAFYDTTGGPGWKNDTNWKTNAPLADWHGVVTDSTGHVTELRLANNDLTGRLPSELGSLERLETLVLAWNDLTGSIPAAMRALSNLEELHLYWNILEGGVPTWLGDLPRLRRLNLGFNALSGSVPAALGTLENLESLDLSYNWGLLGPIPREWRGRGLRDLNIFATQACAPAALGPLLATIDFNGPPCNTPSRATIDIAVVFTPAASQAAGGLGGMAARIDLMIDEANQAYEASGVPHRLALVTRREVSYRETGDSNVDLTRLADPSDGHMDGVHALRDRTGADLVHLVVAESDVGGNAYLGGPFSLTCLDCGGVTFTIVHGHNMGLWRDRYHEENHRLGVRSHPAYGYVNRQGLSAGAPRSKRWRTIMAEETECRDAGITCQLLLYFSNSDRSRDDDPLGIPFGAGTGAGAPADAAAVLDTNGPAVAAWRDRPAGANRAPEARGTLSDQTLELSGTRDVDVSRAFVDPDGDALTYAASSSAPGVVAVSAARARVTLTAQGVGTATVQVTATDPDGLSAVQSFTVTVITSIVRAPFTDDPIRPGVTPVRAVHFTELRDRIDALRAANGLGRFRWTDPALRAGATAVRLVHMTELRSALAAAYTAAGRPVPRWTDPAPVAGRTAIRAVHLTELRAAVVALE